jgi:hypothetical protein
VVGLESGWYTAKVWNQDMTLLFGQADIYIGADQTVPKIENDLLKSNLK